MNISNVIQQLVLVNMLYLVLLRFSHVDVYTCLFHCHYII